MAGITGFFHTTRELLFLVMDLCYGKQTYIHNDV